MQLCSTVAKWKSSPRASPVFTMYIYKSGVAFKVMHDYAVRVKWAFRPRAGRNMHAGARARHATARHHSSALGGLEGGSWCDVRQPAPRTARPLPISLPPLLLSSCSLLPYSSSEPRNGPTPGTTVIKKPRHEPPSSCRALLSLTPRVLQQPVKDTHHSSQLLRQTLLRPLAPRFVL